MDKLGLRITFYLFATRAKEDYFGAAMRLKRMVSGVVALLFWVAVIAIALVSLARFLFIDVAVVGHQAMAPTLLAGDELLVLKGAELEVGDIAVCPHPKDPSDIMIGRVVARGGSTLKSDRGKLMLNGNVARYEPGELLSFTDTTRGRTDTMRVVTEKVGPRAYTIFQRQNSRNQPIEFVLRETKVQSGLYLMSDNRDYYMHDSRSFGEVDASSCLGRAFLRLSRSDDTIAELGHGYFDFLR